MANNLDLAEIKSYAAAGRQCPCCLERFDCLPECTAAQDGPREHEALEAGRADDRTILGLVERVADLEAQLREREAGGV